jgi:deazaflavin-dependent oxidoreductase (nitroreductase family)
MTAPGTSSRPYVPRPLLARVLGDRLAPRFRPALVRRLSAPGRISGRWRTTPVALLEHDGAHFVVSVFGLTDWALDLRAAGQGRITRPDGRTADPFTAHEVPVAERADVLAAYQRTYGSAPGVAGAFRALPDPADHPVFRLELQ